MYSVFVMTVVTIYIRGFWSRRRICTASVRQAKRNFRTGMWRHMNFVICVYIKITDFCGLFSVFRPSAIDHVQKKITFFINYYCTAI